MSNSKFKLGEIVVIKSSLPEAKKEEIRKKFDLQPNQPHVSVVAILPGSLPFKLMVENSVKLYKKERGRDVDEDTQRMVGRETMVVINNARYYMVSQDDFEVLDPLSFLKELKEDGVETVMMTGKGVNLENDIIKLFKEKTWPKKETKKGSMDFNTQSKQSVSFQDVEDSMRRSMSTPSKKDGNSSSGPEKKLKE